MHAGNGLLLEIMATVMRHAGGISSDVSLGVAVTLCPIEDAASKVPPEIAAEQGLRKFKEWNPNK